MKSESAIINRDLQQQRQQPKRKVNFKDNSRLFQSDQFVNLRQFFFLELNSEGPNKNSQRERKTRRRVLTSSQELGMSKAFVKGRERNVANNVMHVQSCLLIKTIAFLKFSLPLPSWLLTGTKRKK